MIHDGIQIDQVCVVSWYSMGTWLQKLPTLNWQIFELIWKTETIQTSPWYTNILPAPAGVCVFQSDAEKNQTK